MEIEPKAIKYSGMKIQELLCELTRMLTKQSEYYFNKRDATGHLNEFAAWEQMRKRNDEALHMIEKCSEILRWQ